MTFDPMGSSYVRFETVGKEGTITIASADRQTENSCPVNPFLNFGTDKHIVKYKIAEG
jgi:hypothetical protein